MKSFREWHTNLDTEVYHNNKNCTKGNNIEDKYLAEGKGGKRLCSECKKRNKA